MTIRGFFARHRTATGVLTPAALGVALLVALTWALWSAPPRTVDTELTASTADCHDMVTLSIAGRGDSPRPGTTKMLVDADGNELPAASADDYVSTWIDQASSAPLKAVAPGSYAAMYIAYPADMSSYEDSVDTGVANAESVIKAIRASCPDTKFAIVGYSEGADVARRVAQTVGHQEADADGKYGLVDPANVVGVVILADAGRADGQGPFPGAKNPFTNPDGFDLKYQNGKNPVSGQGALPNTGGSDFGALAGRVASFCSDGDLTCAAPQNISLLQLVVNVGRQLNVDALQRDQLTLATGMDVATVLSRVVLNAFAEIKSQPDWMQSDQTFLDVLLQVSDPSYTGPAATTTTTTPTTEPGTTAVSATADSISTEKMSPLAYLPQKLFKEIVGLIVTNQNTIPVIMSDPYQLTLAPGDGHHFDYWRDADTANGKPLTSADYAAAWLTYRAKQAQAGQQVDPKAKLSADELSAALSEVASSSSTSSAASSVAPAAPTASPSAPSTDPASQPTTDTAASTPTETAAPSPEAPAATTSEDAGTTTDAPSTPETISSRPDSSTPVTTTTAAPTTTPAVKPTPSR